MRYETNSDIDLQRKLDFDPEVENYLGDIVYLGDLREGEFSQSRELMGKFSPNTFHELFSDPRLQDEEVLEIEDEKLENMQIILDENRPAIGERPGYFFRKGYENSGSQMMEDPVTGVPTLKEFVEVREDPFRDTEYVQKDYEGTMSSVPGLREFFRGREKKLSDRFYNPAAGEVNKRIGNTYIDVI